MRHSDWCVCALTLALAWPRTAAADNDCEFATRASTLRLLGDCSTDATISVPDGMTLDGAGHTLSAMDPPDGSFQGAVVESAGTTAHVRRLTIDTQMLVNVCGGADGRLRGILFEGASGSVVGSRILDIRKQDSSCQEGHAIEVRGGDGAPVQATLVGNHIEGYQKTGILAVGDVRVDVSLNRIIGLGDTERIAQNGIQLSAGATGSIKLNRIEGNRYVVGSFTSTGILLLSAGEGVDVELNRIESNDVGIFLISTSGAVVRANRVEDSTYDGISVDGRTGPAEDNRIVANDVRNADNGIDLFGAGAQGNLVEKNRVRDARSVGLATVLDADANQLTKNIVHDSAYGVVVDSDDNEVTYNLILGSSVEGLAVSGSGNVVENNLVR